MLAAQFIKEPVKLFFPTVRAILLSFVLHHLWSHQGALRCSSPPPVSPHYANWDTCGDELIETKGVFRRTFLFCELSEKNFSGYSADKFLVEILEIGRG